MGNPGKSFGPVSRRFNRDALTSASDQLVRLAFEIIAISGDDPHAVLSRQQTLVARMDGIADDAFAEVRRAGQ